jgi:hypothetical protein
VLLFAKILIVRLFVLARQSLLGQGLLIHEVSRSHTTTHHSRQDFTGRVISSSLWPLPDNTKHSQQTTSTPPVGFESKISTGERPQTYALDRATTGTDSNSFRKAKAVAVGDITVTAHTCFVTEIFLSGNFFFNLFHKKSLSKTFEGCHPRCVSNKSNYKLYAYIVKHNYILGGMLLTICKAHKIFSHNCQISAFFSSFWATKKNKTFRQINTFPASRKNGWEMLSWVQHKQPCLMTDRSSFRQTQLSMCLHILPHKDGNRSVLDTLQSVLIIRRWE